MEAYAGIGEVEVLRDIATPQSRSHVLVVDDDELIRDFIGTFLEMEGYRVTTAASSEEVLVYIRAIQFDVLVADFMLPGRNGVWLVGEIERIMGKRDFGVLVISARHDFERNALAIGAEFLGKPFKLDTFAERVKRLVGQCAQRRRDASVL